jgi:hypothetical protein
MSAISFLKSHRLGAVFVLAFCLSVAGFSSTYAQSNGSLAQGYTVDGGRGQVVSGALVSLKADSQGVELAATDTADRLVGVVDQKPLVAISGGTQESQIVLSGTTTVLVSDINGTIKAGDKITASPIAGVGMRTTTDSRVVGVAQTDFDSSKAQKQTVIDIHSQSHEVYIGYIQLQVGLANYQAPGSNFLPPFVQNVANSVAGKQVSLIRVVFAMVILLFSFVSIGILMSSSIRSAMISLGRNPLAAANIRKSLYQVGGVTLLVLGATLLACYFILIL